MANTQTRRAASDSRPPDSSSTAIAAPHRSRSLFGGWSRQVRSQAESKPQSRGSRLTSFWKALIITSFVINIVLLTVVLLLVGFIVQWRQQITSTAVLGQGFAADNVAELRSIVAGLQGATIRTTIPLDQPLPLKGAGVIVPVDQQTTVTLVEPVPLQLSGADIDLGNGNRLRANNIRLTLPAGTPLRIALKMDIPLDDVTIPVRLNVPVEIPLKDTELGPQFQRLGWLVDRLVGPLAPVLGLDPIPPAPPAPRYQPSSQP
jgi:hypothetical protein